MRISIAICLFILCGCRASKISTTWKTVPIAHDRYYRILVVAVLPEADSVLRRSIETDAAKWLSGYGYYAQSAISTFGPKGLAASSQEATYLKLCDKGIDAVLTFALVPEIENDDANSGQYLHPNSFFYNRMWNYKKMQGDPDFLTMGTRYKWETIMFDLFTLQAISVMRTRSFTDYHHNEITNQVTSLVASRMLKEKILKKRKPALKAF